MPVRNTKKLAAIFMEGAFLTAPMIAPQELNAKNCAFLGSRQLFSMWSTNQAALWTDRDADKQGQLRISVM